jgi:hypothetical protein
VLAIANARIVTACQVSPSFRIPDFFGGRGLLVADPFAPGPPLPFGGLHAADAWRRTDCQNWRRRLAAQQPNAFAGNAAHD